MRQLTFWSSLVTLLLASPAGHTSCLCPVAKVSFPFLRVIITQQISLFLVIWRIRFLITGTCKLMMSIIHVLRGTLQHFTQLLIWHIVWLLGI